MRNAPEHSSTMSTPLPAQSIPPGEGAWLYVTVAVREPSRTTMQPPSASTAGRCGTRADALNVHHKQAQSGPTSARGRCLTHGPCTESNFSK